MVHLLCHYSTLGRCRSPISGRAIVSNVRLSDCRPLGNVLQLKHSTNEVRPIGSIRILLTERTKRVLAHLLAMEGPASVAQISAGLGLTPAQVRYCLRSLEPWLGGRGIALQKTPRVGVCIDAPCAVRQSLLDDIRRAGATQVLLSKEERLQLLTLRLLMAHSAVPLPALAQQLEVSRSTLFRDLDAARKWLGQHGLGARTRRGAGVQIQGSEACWRNAMVAVLLANVDAGTFISACVLDRAGPPAQIPEYSPVLVRARDFLQALDLEHAEQIVLELETVLEAAFVDQVHMELVLHLALAVRRTRRGHIVDHPDASGSVTTSPAGQQLSPDAQRWLGKKLGESLPAAEQAFVLHKIHHAMSAGLVPRHPREAREKRADHPSRTAAGMLAKEAAKYLHARLFHDEELINCLALELSKSDTQSWSERSVAGYRPWGAMPSTSALHGFTQRMLAPIIESHGYLPSDYLLSSIAMHLETALQRLSSNSVRRKVWVICGSGVATARNLISRLNLHLPQVGILGLASAFELARDPALVRGADAIISTIPLEWMTDIEVLQVSPLLTKEEVTRLSLALQLDPPKTPLSHTPSPTTGLSLAKLLAPRTIQRNVVAHDWEEVVDCAGALLLDVGAVWPSYIEAMKDMIRLYGPYVVVAPGAALLHAGPEMGGKRLCMSLVTLRHPVPFGHPANDPVHVALAFSSIDHSTHVEAVGEAMALLSDRDTLRALGRAESAEHALRIIGNALATVPPAPR